jgi:hypothetical protein
MLDVPSGSVVRMLLWRKARVVDAGSVIEDAFKDAVANGGVCQNPSRKTIRELLTPCGLEHTCRSASWVRLDSVQCRCPALFPLSIARKMRRWLTRNEHLPSAQTRSFTGREAKVKRPSIIDTAAILRTKMWPVPSPR